MLVDTRSRALPFHAETLVCYTRKMEGSTCALNGHSHGVEHAPEMIIAMRKPRTSIACREETT